MKIHCKASNTATDVCCTVCGQSFLLYWTRSCAHDRASTVEIQQVLSSHHLHHETSSCAAHPGTEFSVSVVPHPGYLESLGAYA